MISLKQSVRIRNPFVAMAVMISIVHESYKELGVEAIITSNADGLHSHNSLHWMGFALDWRTNHLNNDLDRKLVSDRIRSRLGVDFDVVLESDHLHTEWHPKGPIPISRRT